MMRSMFTGVSSLRLHQTRMDVIANNIANVNTDGFKGQRTTFMESFYQNLQGATGADPEFGRAGTNAMQVGLGINIASIDNMMQQGIARRTDRNLDVAIEGGGFFIVQDRGGRNLFTRAGNVQYDAHGNLHINGNSLMGWSTVRNPNVPGGWAVERGALQPLVLTGEKRNMPAEPTTQINMVGNLNRSQLNECPNTGTRFAMVPKTIYDSLGNRYTINLRFTYHPEVSEAAGSPHGYWTMEAMGGYYVMDAATGEWTNNGGTVTAGDAGAIRLTHARRDDAAPNEPNSLIALCLMGPEREGAPIIGVSTHDFAALAHSAMTIAFNSVGDVIGIGHADRDDTGLIYGPGGFPRPVTFQPQAVGTDPYRWLGRSFNMRVIPIQGVAPSATFGQTHDVSAYNETQDPGLGFGDTMISVGRMNFDFSELGQRGQANTTITALPMDGGGPGELRDISVSRDGTVVGLFSNGRDRVLGQIPLAFFRNPAGLERVGNGLWSATANSGPFDGIGVAGDMIGGALEGSNVDLANEFTEMIMTQRGFQAASRTITVSDEMLQELVNLRR